MSARPVADRFWEKVNKTESCWLWTGFQSQGYGRITWVGGRRFVYAHRWSYEALVGPIPEGLVIDHLCRNRACVNPDHLEPVTLRENIDRGLASSTKTHCIHGHEFTLENTYRNAGRRHCRMCRCDISRRYVARRAGVAA